jgi:16S rRNA (cytosine1402-N4)-methyltransferase
VLVMEINDSHGKPDLAYAVAGCYPAKARHDRIHPATPSFQALRMAVNDELGALLRLLQHAPDWLETADCKRP